MSSDDKEAWGEKSIRDFGCTLHLPGLCWEPSMVKVAAMAGPDPQFCPPHVMTGAFSKAVEDTITASLFAPTSRVVSEALAEAFMSVLKL